MNHSTGCGYLKINNTHRRKTMQNADDYFGMFQVMEYDLQLCFVAWLRITEISDFLTIIMNDNH